MNTIMCRVVVALMLMSGVMPLYAQTSYQIGTGTETKSTVPIYSWYTEYPYTQQLYLASEMMAAGMSAGPITKIAFQYYGTPKLDVLMDIYMVHVPTTTNNLAEGYYTAGLRRVAQSKAVTFKNNPVQAAGRWIEIELDEPFSWDGTSNIAVSIQQLSLSEKLDCDFMCSLMPSMSVTSLNEDATVPLRLSNVPQTSSVDVTTVIRDYRPNIKFYMGSCTPRSASFAFATTTYEIDPGEPFAAPTPTGAPAGTQLYYTSSNPYVATVNTTTGSISLTGEVGITTITAEWPASGSNCAKFASYTISVKDNCNTVGTGTTSGAWPFRTNNGYSYSQMIYLGSEINSSCRIHSISFESTGDNTTTRYVNIYLGTTTKTKFDSETDFVPMDQLTPVYSGQVKFNAGWNRYEFNVADYFDYDESQNLVVAVSSRLVHADGFLTSTPFMMTQTTDNTVLCAYTDDWRELPTPDYYDGQWENYPSGTLRRLLLADYRPNIDICMYCCDLRPNQFAYDTNEANYALGTVFDAPTLQNTTGSNDVHYESSDETVATVDNDGTVTMVGNTGEAIISATIDAANGFCTSSAQYIVRARQYAELSYETATSSCGGTASAPPESQVGLGMVPLSTVVPTCSEANKVFLQWNTMEDGSGDAYYPGGSFPLLTNTTIYAIYGSPCCSADSALLVTYTHNGKTDTATRSTDGFYNFDICLHSTLEVVAQPKEGCSYSDAHWDFCFANSYQLRTVVGNTFVPPSPYSATFDSIIGYDLVFSATSASGCEIKLPGRVRVSDGIKVAKISDDPFVICPGAPTEVSIGYLKDDKDYVMVNRTQPSTSAVMGHTDTIFLPDGQDCGGGGCSGGCSYISSVEFNQFETGATVRSVEDIRYLQMNIEHSYIGDLFITLECPYDAVYGGRRKVAILKFGGTSDSECKNCIPASMKGWSDQYYYLGGWHGTTMMTGTADTRTNTQFGWTVEIQGEGADGYPHANDPDYLCNSSEEGNRFGKGWNYVWSETSEQEFVYAGGSTNPKLGKNKVYFTSNHLSKTNDNAYTNSTSFSHDIKVVDSSDLANKRQIYVPDQSFENLVGCPLNGEWTITVQDGYRKDNGWLFGWSLALNEDYLRSIWGYNPGLDTSWATCDWFNTGNFSKYNDNFIVNAPPDFTGGTVTCNVVTVDDFGCEVNNEVNLPFIVKNLILDIESTNTSCSGDDGHIALMPDPASTGVQPYSYSLDGGALTDSRQFDNVTFGNHNVTVSDIEGCVKTFNVKVGMDSIKVSEVVEEHVNVICSGKKTGRFKVTATGGHEPYTFAVEGLDTNTTGLFENVGEGTYNVVITDGSGSCRATQPIEITTTTPPITVVGGTLTQPEDGQCPLPAGSNYSITGTISGGTAPYTHEWKASTSISGSTSGVTALATILSDGSCGIYKDTLIVADANGCTNEFAGQFTTAAATPTIAYASGVTAETDWGCDAGGERTDPTVASFVVTDACNAAPQVTLTPGTITETGCSRNRIWTATYKNSCDEEATPLTITHKWIEAVAPTISPIAAVAATAAGDCTYQISDLSAVVLANSEDNCGGTVSFVSQDDDGVYSQITSGTRTIEVEVVVSGTCGLTQSASVDVTIPQDDMTLSTNIPSGDTAVCAGGSVVINTTATGTAGISGYTWMSAEDATVNGTNSSYTASPTASPTTYTVTATDDNGCTRSKIVTVEINPETSITLATGSGPSEQSICLGQSIETVTLDVVNGTLDSDPVSDGHLTLTDNIAATGQIVIAGKPQDTATYTLTVNSNQKPQCASKDFVVKFMVADTITPNITCEDTICINTSLTDTVLTITETNGSADDQYVWSVGENGTIITGQGTNSITAKWTTGGDKTISVTIKHGTLECESHGTKYIYVQSVPTVALTTDNTVVCPNVGTVDFDATLTGSQSGDYTYTFSGDLSYTPSTTSNSASAATTTATLPNDCGVDYTTSVTVVDNRGCTIKSEPRVISAQDNQAPVVMNGVGGNTIEAFDTTGCTSDPSTLYPAVQTAQALVNDLYLTVNDDCTPIGQLVVTHRDSVMEATCVKSVRRYYIVTDLCGNKDSVYQQITVHMPDTFQITDASTSADVDCLDRDAVGLNNTNTRIVLPTVTDGCGQVRTPLNTLPTPVTDVASCTGTRTFTYKYEDCEEHDTTWTFTYNISLPELTMSNPTILKDTVPCENAATSATSFNTPSGQLYDACGNLVTPVPLDEDGNVMAQATAESHMNPDGTGTVIYTWRYTDCAGREYLWKRQHDVIPDNFSGLPNVEITVQCADAIVEPQTPDSAICGTQIPFTIPPVRDSASIENGCYKIVYSYEYEVFDQTYTWVYTYNLVPARFEAPQNVVNTTLECIKDTVTPSYPVVINPACGDTLVPTGPTVTATNNHCLDTVVYTYRFSDCTGYYYDWTYTYIIAPAHGPHEEPNALTHQMATTSAQVECFADADTIDKADLPVVVSVCGDTLAPSNRTYVDAVNADGCTGTRTYTYTYTDCTGATYIWNFVYTVLRTIAPYEEPVGGDIAKTESTVVCIDEAVRPQMPLVLDVCGNPLSPAADSTITRTHNNCEDTVVYQYHYYDPSTNTLYFDWTFTYYIHRDDIPANLPRIIVDVVPAEDTVDCFADATEPTTLPTVVDVCGDTILNPTVTFVDHHDQDTLCSGDRTYTFTYTDCTGRMSIDWVYVRRVIHPQLVVPADSTRDFTCVSAAQHYPATAPLLVNACGDTIEAVPDPANPYVNVDASDFGSVVYKYTYIDCDGIDNAQTWQYVCNVDPDIFTPPADSARTVSCLSAVHYPSDSQRPDIVVCEDDVPFDADSTIIYSTDFNDTCGTVTYEYPYTVHGQRYTWSYIYTLEPEDFIFPTDVPTADDIECFDVTTMVPTLPDVVNSCGDTIKPTSLVIDSSDYRSHDGCHGEIVYTYTYKDCNNHSHDWVFTYNVHHTTPPHAQVDADTAAVVACFDDATEPQTLPMVVDVCGRAIDAPEPLVTESGTSCDGWRLYTYNYYDCDSVLLSWTFRYTVRDTIAPHIDLAAFDMAQAVAVAAGGCQYVVADLSSPTLMATETDNCSEVYFDSQNPSANDRFSQPMADSVVSVQVIVRDACFNRDTAYIDITLRGRASNIELSATSASTGTLTSEICAGDTIVLSVNATTFNGIQSYTWTPQSNLIILSNSQVSAAPTVDVIYRVDVLDSNGCTLSDTLAITVHQATSTAYTETACDTFDWTNNATTQSFTQSGTYLNQYTTTDGCTSVDTLHLTVYHNTSTLYQVNDQCDRYQWYGQTYTADGEYYHSYVTADGCPSVDTLQLTLRHNSSTAYQDQSCDSYTWTRNAQTYSETGVYLFTYTNNQGCPSVDTLNLTIHHSTVTTLTVTACDSYLWYSNTYQTSTVAEHLLTDRYGCDSTLALYLTINYSKNVTVGDTICAGETYYFFNSQLTTSGTYNHTTQATNGCDSNITMVLTVVPRPPLNISTEYNCATSTYRLQANSQATLYQWSSIPDDPTLNGQSTLSEIMVSPTRRTLYTLLAGYPGLMQCAVSDTVTLKPVSPVVAQMETKPVALYRENLDWSAIDLTVTEDWRQWYIDGIFMGDDLTVSGTADEAVDSLTIVLIVGADYCTDTATAVIPMLREGLYVPNVFTPDLKINRQFGAQGVGITSFKLDVYNRGGMLVFRTDDIHDTWDGSHNGIPCPMGSYVWRIIYSTEVYPDVTHEIVGQVLLLR